MLTAKHIVDGVVASPRRYNKELGRWTNVWDCLVMYVGGAGLWPGNDNARLFSATITIPGRGDIAVLQVDTSGSDAPPGAFACLRLHLNFPLIQDRVLVFGYHSLTQTVTAETATELALNLNAGGLVANGTVTAVHTPRKANSIADMPCFDIDFEDVGGVRVGPGMSGSPVIDSGGSVVGVFSHSPSWQPTATAASLALVTALRVELLRPICGVSAAPLMYELMSVGAVKADDSLKDVLLEPKSDGSFDVWVRAGRNE